MKIVPLNIEGLTDSENRSVASRLLAIMVSWEGTRYMAGCQSKKVGVDCVRFVSGVLDELYGETTRLARLPQDIGFHCKEGAYAGLKSFMSKYPREEVKDYLEPGDILIAGPDGGGPGHALIAGINCLWHCDSKRVCRTGTDFGGNGYIVKKVYRLANRERWKR